MPTPPRRVIPREELTAWERWELGALHEEAQERARAAAHAPAAPVAAPEPSVPPPAQPAPEPAPVVQPEPESVAPMQWPTAEEIEAIQQQAQREGFEAGLEAGRLAAELEVERLKALLMKLQSLVGDLDAALADKVLDLALVVGRQMVRKALEVDRERLLPLLREALATLPPMRPPARLFLNPADQDAVEALLGGELPADVWRLVPDPQIEAGGCRIDSSTSSADLSLATRWAGLVRVLGREQRADLAWQAEPQDAGEADDIAARDQGGPDV
ncbi:flagellar assembly protein FliH [Chitiniphilus purpureus]|uniref:Flagellar assembly protein FliH n=1 Tax=Chitiniphilus purpureus TaxID=2981137 RepID=A0ABY6DJP9_9NEIS|nr:flagellar assembly protein FliH [Chitiniphilus sp. CD1]UXY14590.1 flagellar assembly protein FliH [Chitiniphilus sp. CD1]